MKLAQNLPSTISMSLTGDVLSNSIVPDRFSSAKSRIVTAGVKKSKITLT